MSDTLCPIPECNYESSGRGVVIHGGSVHKTKRMIQEELHRMFEHKSRAPTFDEYQETGLFTIETVNKEYGSFGTALAVVLGVESDECVSDGCSLYFTDTGRMNSHITRAHNVKQEILEDLKSITEEIDRTPTSLEYREKGQFTDITIQRHFKSYNVALIQAGFPPNNADGLSDEYIRELVEKVVDDLGYIPTKKRLNKELPISASTVARRFGETDRYHESMRSLGFDYTGSSATRIHWENIYHKIDVLVDDLNRLGEKFERVGGDIIDEYGRFDSMTYIRTFGNLSRAFQRSDVRIHGARSGEDHPYWKGGVKDWRGSNWSSVRNTIRDRDDHQCRICGNADGYGKSGLEVHHIKPFHEFEKYEDANDLDNLVLLCTSCHASNEGKWPSKSVDEWVEVALSEHQLI